MKIFKVIGYQGFWYNNLDIIENTDWFIKDLEDLNIEIQIFVILGTHGKERMFEKW